MVKEDEGEVQVDEPPIVCYHFKLVKVFLSEHFCPGCSSDSYDGVTNNYLAVTTNLAQFLLKWSQVTFSKVVCHRSFPNTV